MQKSQIIFLLFLLIQSKSYQGNIISIPLNKFGEKIDIETKNWIIKYYLIFRDNDDIGPFPSFYVVLYQIEKMKNLKMINTTKYRGRYDHRDKNKDTVYLRYSSHFEFELDKFNKDLCELFYNTKYIDKKIISIAKNLENKSFKYFGGTPKYLIENLSKFTFTENDILSYIELIFGRKNKCKYKLNINLTINHKIEFKDDSHLICFSHDIFFELKNLLLAQYEEYVLYIQYRRYSLYHLSSEQKKSFPEIKLKIGNIIVSLNERDLIDDKNYLFIQNTPCDNIILGAKVLDKFEIREYNLETKELNLYSEKYPYFIRIDRTQKLELNSYSYSFITLIILLFMVFATFIMLINLHSKNNNIDYFIFDEI